MKSKRPSVGAIISGCLIVAAGAGVVYFFSAKENIYEALEAGRRSPELLEEIENRAIKNPDDLDAQKWMVRIEVENGKFDAARNRLYLLSKNHPDEYATSHGYCLISVRKQDWNSAALACGKALGKSDRSLFDLKLAATAYLKTAKLADAYPVLMELKAMAPHDPELINNLGYYYYLKREYDKAMQLFNQALEMDPSLLSSRRNIARIYVAQKDYKAAIQELKGLLAVAPDDAGALSYLSFIYIRNIKDYDQAQKYLDLAIQNGLDGENARYLKTILEETRYQKGGSLPDLPAPDLPPKK